MRLRYVVANAAQSARPVFVGALSSPLCLSLAYGLVGRGFGNILRDACVIHWRWAEAGVKEVVSIRERFPG